MKNRYEYTGQQLWYHSNFKELLSITSMMLNKLNIKFWLDWGTLLGAVRNRKILPWDFDVDLGIFAEDMNCLWEAKKEFQKIGFDLWGDPTCTRVFKDDLTFHLDIWAWGEKNEEFYLTYGEFVPSYCARRPKILLLPLKDIEFEGALYPCPCSVEEWLILAYGDDWETEKVYNADISFINKHDPNNIDILNRIKNLNR